MKSFFSLLLFFALWFNLSYAQTVFPNTWNDRQNQPSNSSYHYLEFWNNPAYAGNTEEYNLTVFNRTSNFRGIGNKQPQTIALTWDFPWYALQSGFGLRAYYQKYERQYESSVFGFGLGHNFKFEVGEQFNASAGYSVMMTGQDHFVSDARYPAFNVGNVKPLTSAQIKNEPFAKLEYGVGFSLYSDKLRIGAAYDHINEQSFFYYTATKEIEVKIYQKLFFDVAYEFDLSSNMTLTPMASITNIRESFNIDGGFKARYNEFAFLGALFQHSGRERISIGNFNNQSLSILAGVTLFDNYDISLAYDVPLKTSYMPFEDLNEADIEIVLGWRIAKPNPNSLED